MLENLRKLTGNNPNLDLVNINTQTKFGQNLSIHSKSPDIDQKLNSERNSDISQGPELCYKCAKNEVKQFQTRCCQYRCI